jgi:hypothetical protein
MADSIVSWLWCFSVKAGVDVGFTMAWTLLTGPLWFLKTFLKTWRQAPEAVSNMRQVVSLELEKRRSVESMVREMELMAATWMWKIRRRACQWKGKGAFGPGHLKRCFVQSFSYRAENVSLRRGRLLCKRTVMANQGHVMISPRDINISVGKGSLAFWPSAWTDP